ncbi:MAG: hypothetical protein HQL96_02510 [Magnetococcales bacterium]|nr:hypothetical protein [Magnetococcales bacterium]
MSDSVPDPSHALVGKQMGLQTIAKSPIRFATRQSQFHAGGIGKEKIVRGNSIK